MFNPYQNPYGIYPQNSFPQNAFPQNVLPQQQILQVNGKASVDTMQLAPNSSLLAMDTTAPIVWMCVSDGVGKVTATPYDIVVHKEIPPVDMNSVEQRVSNIEKIIAEMEERINVKSNVGRLKSKSNIADDSTD